MSGRSESESTIQMTAESSLVSIQVAIVAIFFITMGLAALISPHFVVGFFRLSPVHPDSRNEVRAVYGGFGVAVGALLFAAPFYPGVNGGVLLAVCVSLLGMAGGRIVAALIEWPGQWPVVFFFVECALAVMLLLDI
uniref:DUF4345 domain-containing protein n=1 Tax=Vitrella brassicaformis TaxID=1169539 RepID=A0A6U4IR41_9ALVE